MSLTRQDELINAIDFWQSSKETEFIRCSKDGSKLVVIMLNNRATLICERCDCSSLLSSIKEEEVLIFYKKKNKARISQLEEEATPKVVQ